MAPVLIGREHPVSVLRTRTARAAESHGGLVLVTGEAGIGKTALVTEAADEARRLGALVLGGSCWDSDTAPGHWPWVQVLRGLRRGTEESEWAEAERAAGGRLSVLLGEDRNTAPAREGEESFPLYDAVTTALVTASQRRPLVVVLEDLHWADPASLKLLEFAAQHAWFERLLLIGTYRDVEVESADHPLQRLILPLAARAAATVTLTGLGRDEVAALIALTGGAEPAPELVDEVHRRTGGNPFFVEQTVRLWRGGGPVSAVAPGVREAVRRRLALLPGEVCALLEAAAVLGREFHRQVLAATVAAPVPHVDRLLERAVAARLITVRTGGRFAFAHDLVRETLYAALDEGPLRARHAAVVRALDGSPVLSEKTFPADLARHAYLAGDELERETRVELLAAAARDASGRLAAEEAEGHFRRAIEAAGDDRRRIALLLLELGGAQWHQGEVEGAWRSLDQAVELARELPDPALLARVAITLHQHESTGAGRTASTRLLRDAHRALIGGGGADPTGLSTETIAQDLAVESAALARGDADDDALAFSLWARHDAIWGLGTSAERLALTAEMISLAGRSGDTELELHANSMRWVTLLELGDPGYAEQLRVFGALAERIGQRRHELSRAIDESLVAALTGRFAEAEKLLAEVVEAVEGKRRQEPYAYTAGHMRWSALLLQGRYEEAQRALGEVEGVAHPYPALLAGLTAIERGDLALALRAADEPEVRPDRLPRVFQPLALRLRAQVAAASGDPARIAEARAALAPHSGQWVVSLYGCDIGGPVDLWVGLLDAAAGDRASAVAALTAAYESADRMRARPWSVRARAALLTVLGTGLPADAGRGTGAGAGPGASGGAGAGAGPGAASGAGPDSALLSDADADASRRAASGADRGSGTGPGTGLGTGLGTGSGSEAGRGFGFGFRTGTGTGAGFGIDVEELAAGVRRDAGELGMRHLAEIAGPAPGGGPGSGGPGSPATGARVSGDLGPGPDRPAGPGANGREEPAPAEHRFRREGAVWALSFGGREAHMPDAKGLRDLHTLLGRPGDDLSAVSLLAPEAGPAAVAARSLGGDPVLDERAKLHYRRRLERLDEEIDRAAELGDDRRAREFTRERTALLDELRTAAGLGGRTRRLGDEAERARKTVTARIRDTLRKLEPVHPELAAHMRESVTTGAYCSYRPAKPLSWRL
ncbi:ATP-binding protein [Streptomyces sp. NPDC020141]|uniref:ATP-binding protein n=1 Tax=Streptomyces sp. NPDC020141 TaxID=3365065 RepID=UPI0037A13354